MIDHAKGMQEKLCVIVGASAVVEEDFFFYMDMWKAEDRPLLLIAADAGYRFVREQRIEPDLIVGDFDSLGSVPEHRRIVRHPVQKDETDLLLAVKEAEKEGCTEFAVFGGLGGRPDHSFANIQLLTFLQERGQNGILFGETMHMTVLLNGTLLFPQQFEGLLSVFALSGQAGGVTLQGFKYELKDDVIDRAFPLGVSNEFTGRQGVISVQEGELLVMWQRENQLLPQRP
ncbi:MAG: thiamine diphosphokinase [Lachnospiraceae bacterium]|nr:thiamine diphosphokinase [Lachnospiraceae bacterium]